MYKREPDSKAVLNTNVSDYDKYLQSKNQIKKLKATEAEVYSTKAELAEIKKSVLNIERMLKELVCRSQ